MKRLGLSGGAYYLAGVGKLWIIVFLVLWGAALGYILWQHARFERACDELQRMIRQSRLEAPVHRDFPASLPCRQAAPVTPVEGNRL